MAQANFPCQVLWLVQAFQFTDANGEVCPASWKPGDASIKPDVEGSKEYFDSVVDDETLEYLDAGFKKLQVTISNLEEDPHLL